MHLRNKTRKCIALRIYRNSKTNEMMWSKCKMTQFQMMQTMSFVCWMQIVKRWSIDANQFWLIIFAISLQIHMHHTKQTFMSNQSTNICFTSSLIWNYQLQQIDARLIRSSFVFVHIHMTNLMNCQKFTREMHCMINVNAHLSCCVFQIENA